MSGLLPFALNRHRVWSPFAAKLHAAVWDHVGLERVREFVRQWSAEWQELQSRFASKVAELRPEDPSCRSPEAPTLPLPSPKCERSSAEKWAVLAAIHDAFWRDGEKINPWPEPKDGPAPKTDDERAQVLGVYAEWVNGGGFVYRQLLEQALKLADVDLELAESERRVLDRWLKEVAGDPAQRVGQQDAGKLEWSKPIGYVDLRKALGISQNTLKKRLVDSIDPVVGKYRFMAPPKARKIQVVVSDLPSDAQTRFRRAGKQVDK